MHNTGGSQPTVVLFCLCFLIVKQGLEFQEFLIKKSKFKG